MNGFTDKCPSHRQHPAWNCEPCLAVKVEPEAVPELAQAVRAEMKRRPRPKTRPEPTHDLADTRARADREATT